MGGLTRLSLDGKVLACSPSSFGVKATLVCLCSLMLSVGCSEDKGGKGVRLVLCFLAVRFRRKSFHVLVHLIRRFVRWTQTDSFVPVLKGVVRVSYEVVGSMQIQLCVCVCMFVTVV